MCTAFSQRNYEFVNEFVNVHKIASAELTDTGILSTVNSFKKPVILSTGGSGLDEISHALMYLKDCKVTIMYCVADYPARVVDLRQLQVLKNNFGSNYDYGFSDHTQDLYAIPYMAKLTGASVIEKHCNLAGVVKSDDAAHSISYKDLDFMNYAIQNDPSPARISEFTSTSMRSMWKRRFVATREINQGDRLLLGVNVDIYRTQVASKDPVLTFRPNDIQGKTCLIFKKPGDPICYGDYEIEIE